MLAAVAAAHSAFGGLSADLRAGLEADDEWRSRFQREEQRAAQAFRKHLRMLNTPRDCKKAPPASARKSSKTPQFTPLDEVEL